MPAVPLESGPRGAPYADPVAMATSERDQARRALTFCIELAELLLLCGAGTAEVKESVTPSAIRATKPWPAPAGDMAGKRRQRRRRCGLAAARARVSGVRTGGLWSPIALDWTQSCC